MKIGNLSFRLRLLKLGGDKANEHHLLVGIFMFIQSSFLRTHDSAPVFGLTGV